MIEAQNHEPTGAGTGAPAIAFTTFDPLSETALHRPETRADRAVTCFTPGTMITTRNGKLPVEALKPGDRLLTRDRGFQPLLWQGMRRLTLSRQGNCSGNCPVLICAGALGPGQPERDMIVSPRHRVLTTDPDLLHGLGEPEALVEARVLAGFPGIRHIAPASITYVHLLLENHEVILTENTWTESFQLSSEAARILAEAGGEDVRNMLPCLRTGRADAVQTAARACLSPADLEDRLIA